MEVITGKNAILQFKKEGVYVNFVCCTTFSLNPSREKKSVKTLGDGNKKRYRTQSVGYTLSASGIIPLDDETNSNVFDLLPYLEQGVDIEYRIIYNNSKGTLYKSITGNVGIDSINLDNPVDFVTNSIEATGNGWFEISDLLASCDKRITRVQFPITGSTMNVKVLALNSGTVPRYDWRLDGGGTNTSLSTGWPVAINGLTGHILEIWPVCENGLYGTKYTYPF